MPFKIVGMQGRPPRASNEKTQDSVRAVDRALQILLAYRPGDDELTVAELLTRVALSRPTLYRLLGALQTNGFLVASGEPQRFRLGPSIAQLAHVWTSSSSLGALAQPMMRRLWKSTGETVALFVPEGIYRRCVAELESTQPLSFKRGVGYRERLLLGASGRVILAHTEITPDGFEQYAEGLEVDEQKYPKELAQIRRRGYAVSRDELIQGAVAIAAPFFNGADQVAGSICVFGPGVRLASARVEQVAKELTAEAVELSKVLGHREQQRRAAA